MLIKIISSTNLPIDTDHLTTKILINQKKFHHPPDYQQISIKLSPIILINQKKFYHLPIYQHIQTKLSPRILI